MNINKRADSDNLTLILEGRLDTATAPDLDRELDSTLAGVTNLVFDFTSLEYISSAGLRIILKAQKMMNAKGSMKIVGANEAIMEVFEITGFSDILTIE